VYSWHHETEINISRSLSLSAVDSRRQNGGKKREKERIKYSRVVDAPSSERGRIKASPKIADIFNEKKKRSKCRLHFHVDT
jgi:hypothetical protein